MLYAKKRGSARGSAITETGPALFLLILIIFFPMLDFLSMGAGYIMATIFHDHMIRELACSAPPGSTTDTAIQTQEAAIAKVKAEFKNSTFFNYLKMKDTDMQVSNIAYLGANGQPDNVNPLTVTCTTTLTVQPFISIPWWGPLPGLNAPFPFIITTQRMQEEKGRN